MGWRGRGRYSLVLAVGVGCGPSATIGDGGAGSASTGPGTGASTGPGVGVTATDTGGPPGSTGGGPTTASTTSEPPADTGDKLDLPAMSGSSGGVGAGFYDSCLARPCAPGLECKVIATGKDLIYTMCTAPCEDPVADCPAEPGPAVCHAIAMDDVVCALPCDPQTPCPPGLECLTWLGSDPAVCGSLF